MSDVTTLQDKQDDPVDAGDDVVHAKSSVVMVVLAPYPPSVQGTVMRCMEGVVERDDQGQEPGDSGEDLVDDDGVLAMLVAFSERVDYEGIARQLISKSQPSVF